MQSQKLNKSGKGTIGSRDSPSNNAVTPGTDSRLTNNFDDMVQQN